jgi:hypothetical protein
LKPEVLAAKRKELDVEDGQAQEDKLEHRHDFYSYRCIIDGLRLIR